MLLLSSFATTSAFPGVTDATNATFLWGQLAKTVTTSATSAIPRTHLSDARLDSSSWTSTIHDHPSIWRRVRAILYAACAWGRSPSSNVLPALVARTIAHDPCSPWSSNVGNASAIDFPSLRPALWIDAGVLASAVARWCEGLWVEDAAALLALISGHLAGYAGGNVVDLTRFDRCW